MDSFVIKTIAHELNLGLCPVKITHIELLNHNTIILKTYKERQHKWLVLCAHPAFSHCYLTKIQPKTETSPLTPFLITLRKYLLGSRIEKIETKSMERILILRITPFEAGHKGASLELILELIGKSANCVLIEHESMEILCSLRSVPDTAYHLPRSPKDKVNPLLVKYDDFLKRLMASSQKRWSDDLVSILFGITPTIADEILYQASLDARKPPPGPSLQMAINTIWSALQEILDFYRKPNTAQATYAVSENPQQQPILSAFPLKHLDEKWTLRHFSDMNQAAEAFCAFRIEAVEFAKEKSTFQRFIQASKKRLQRRLSHLKNDRAHALNAEEYRQTGDIIMSCLNTLHKGMEEIQLPNLYDNQKGATISIKLDPTLNPTQNAQRYYRRYQKAKRALSIIEQRIKETESSCALIAEAEKELLFIHDKIELYAISDALKSAGILVPNRPGLQKKTEIKKSPKTIPGIRYFLIEDTWRVLVGKNNKANDYLTRILARSEDFWFHAYNTPGSHVILRNVHKEKKIPPSILEKTAAVAAFFSRQRKADKAIVGYTQRKYIRKTKGLKPGMVLVDYQQTITVTPSLAGVVPHKH
ncbi:MAG: NFACT family protein [bacterium]